MPQRGRSVWRVCSSWPCRGLALAQPSSHPSDLPEAKTRPASQPADSRIPVMGWGRAALFTREPEPDTVEYKQFKVLLEYPDKDPPVSLQYPGFREAMESRRREELERLGVRDDRMSLDELRAGAKAYIRERWQQIWAARRRDVRLPHWGDLLRAWQAHVEEEKALYDAVGRLGLDMDELRPRPGAADDVRAPLSHEPAGPEEEFATLLRALLTPADEALARSIVRYALRVPDRRPNLSPAMRREHWEWVCDSPDPPVPAAALDIVCRPEAREHAEAICRWLLHRARERWGSAPSETQVRELIQCAPEDAIAGAIDLEGRDMLHVMPALKDLLDAPDTRPAIQLALVRCLAGDRQMAPRLLAGPNRAWAALINKGSK